MIPKIIHIINLDGKDSEYVDRLINSIKKYISDYDIKIWSHSNIDTSEFEDSLKNLYIEYYNKKSYSTCEDIAKLYILKKYGGIYISQYSEFVKQLPDKCLHIPFLVSDHMENYTSTSYIWGCEKDNRLVNACIRWFTHHLSTNKDVYNIKWNLNKIVAYFFTLLGFCMPVEYHFGYIKNKDYVSEKLFYDYKVYASEWFCPKLHKNINSSITDKTVTICYLDKIRRR